MNSELRWNYCSHVGKKKKKCEIENATFVSIQTLTNKTDFDMMCRVHSESKTTKLTQSNFSTKYICYYLMQYIYIYIYNFSNKITFLPSNCDY